MAEKNMVMEKSKPARNTCHGIVTVETNLPMTMAPNESVPRFIRILPIFSNCFGVLESTTYLNDSEQ